MSKNHAGHMGPTPVKKPGVNPVLSHRALTSAQLTGLIVHIQWHLIAVCQLPGACQWGHRVTQNYYGEVTTKTSHLPGN